MRRKLTVRLVQVGPVPRAVLAALDDTVNEMLGCPAEIEDDILDPSFAYDPARGQYNSTAILMSLEAARVGNSGRILGVSELDLFIPILTYVFGEAFLNRPPAVISLHRLHPQFYGLPKDPALSLQRAQTEAVHELGHTFGLVHCPDYACVMHASRVADEIDLKGPGFCPYCADHLRSQRLRPRPYG